MSVQNQKKHMSDPATSGDPSGASAATAGPASTAATPGNPAPIGSFGTAKGSGLLRGKRPTPPAASAASSPAPSGYQPSTIEVLRPASEYKNPFTGETSVPAAVINEPAPQAAPTPAPAPIPAPVVVKEAAPAAAPAPAPAMDGELFPFSLNADAKPAAPAAKAELNILPTEEVKRPAMSWGESSHGSNARRDERPTFRPERRDARPFEPREPRREPAAGEPRNDRNSSPRDFSRDERPAPAAAPQKSGGFIAWLKGLFGAKSASPEVRTGDRDDQGRDGGHRHNRRRHRGGRGRGGFQGDNRGPRDGQPYQPRDPRDEEGSSSEGGQGGERRYEGGGRRRHRGGRGRNRDDRGPRPEGQQGGGAI
jgi:hypothetical protein